MNRPPHVTITLELERCSPRVEVRAHGQGELVRLSDWIAQQPSLEQLLQDALDLDEDGVTSEELLRARLAATFNPGSPKWPNKTIGEIYASGEEGHKWVAWVLRNAKSPGLRQAIEEFAIVFARDAYSVWADGLEDVA